MKTKIPFTVFLPFILATFCHAQVPISNLYLIDYIRTPTGIYQFDHPSFLTHDNKTSYNNQPFFIGEELYFTATRNDEQTDIFKCDVGKRLRTQMTDTPESEYSPKATPDGNHFSVVRVSADSLKKQQLWLYSFEGNKRPKLLMENTTNIGYYEWIKNHILACFIVDTPNRLELHNLKSGTRKILKRNVGRCFIATSNNTLLFVDKRNKDAWAIKELNLGNLFIRTIVDTLEGAEDFVLTPHGEILMGKGSSLYKYMQKKDYDWVEIANFSQFGITNITRLAMDGDRIAICDVAK